LFWNNEILNTLRLERNGLLQTYRSPAANDYPPAFQSQRATWYGFAARARVLIVNTDCLDPNNRPTTIHDLADPKWKDRAGIAKPLFGTTATHAAVLFATWGDPEARDYFRRLRNNVQVLSGNRQVAQAVARGQLDFGLTDTDDAMIELEKGSQVEIVYPDQQEGGLGTLFIPNTLALIQDSPNRENSRDLLDYLLSPDVEAFLAESSSAQIPLNTKVTVKSRVETPQTVSAMSVDFDVAAEKWDDVSEFLRDEFVTVHGER
jgi:iron(III) transport system substrate-binding protein